MKENILISEQSVFFCVIVLTIWAVHIIFKIQTAQKEKC